MYVLRLPLIGLEAFTFLGRLRRQHTAVMIARRSPETKRLIFDVVPVDATSTVSMYV